MQANKRKLDVAAADSDEQGSKTLKSSQDTASTSQGSDKKYTAQHTTSLQSSSKNPIEDPPELNKVLPSLVDIKAITKPSKDADLPVDILLLTVTNCEFLACFSELKNPYRCWFDGLGYVYFSDAGERQEELKVALLRFYRNGIGPGGALVSVKNAASVLRPKAVISVGTCSGLNPAKSKLGDVVVSAKLATCVSKVVTNNQEQSTGMRSYVSKRFLNIIKNCADGWQAPLKNPEAQQVQVYTNAEVLSGPEQVRTKWRRDQLAETNPQAMAIENEGEGLFTAAFDCQIEWLIVKGITDYADGSQLPSESWSSFASVMAASLVAHILSEPCVFHAWPHYQDLSEHSSAIRSKEQLPSPSDAESAFLEWSQNQLCSFYNSTASEVMITPWDRDDTMDIDEVYVQLTLLRDDRNVAGTTKERLQDYSELFASHGHHLIPKRILVYGMPGIGKSTLTKKLAVDWSRGNKEILTKFAVVLLIKLRDVCYTQDFCAMLQKAELLSAGDPMVFSQLYDYILHNQQKVLLILDGYDEYSAELSSPVYQIWKSSQLRDCTLLVTTRTRKKGELRPGSHAQFEIYGFDDWQVEKFAFKFLRDQTKVEEFTEFLDERDLRELAKIPLLLLTLVLCWKKYQGTLTSRSDLYYRFCQTLLDHVTAKTSDETFRSMGEYREELAKLGELAWQALLNDTLYVMLSNLPEDIRLSLKKFIDFGFLQTSNLSVSPHREKLAFFLHKSIQEFLSALFIVWNTKNAKETLFGHLAKVDSFERVKKIDAVLKFVCEMSSEAANAVVNHVQMVGEKEGLNRMTSSEELSKDQREFELCLKSYSSMEAVGTEKVGHNAGFSKQSSTSRSKEQLPSPSVPRKIPKIEARNRDSDDEERDFGNLENPRPLQQETNKDISKEPSTSSGPGDSRGDLGSAVSGYSSFLSKEVTSLHPESCPKAEEPRETREIQSSNRDSDDDERDCGSNKPKGPSENPRQMQQETIQDISKEPSTRRRPGDLPGDLVSAVSVYSSFPSEEVTPLDPERSLKAEDDSPASDTDNSPWTDKNVLSSILTSEGGVVDGEGVRLVYPPGAVDSPVNVNVTFEDPSKYEGFLFRKDLENDVMFGAPIINLQPNGYLFKKPVTLTTKFAVQDVKCSDVLVLHGTDANDGKITWEDVTKNAIIDENVQDVTIEIEHFSRIVVLLLKYTCTRSEDICPRFNSLAFHYDLLVFKKSCTSSEEVEREVEEELALLFVSQDVRHEQFDKEQGTSALGQLEKERFVKLHVQRCTDAQPIRRIYDSEFLQVEIYIGEDYEVEKSAEFNVQSSIWWNTGEVVRLALKPNQDVRSLCGTITVQGKLGHISTWHFSEEVSDLCGYVRSLLGVEEAIFNLIPIARSLDMPDEVLNKVTKCWKDESKQLNIILDYWSKTDKNAADVDALRRNLEILKQDHASYKVTKRGQMLIRNLRELATKNSKASLFFRFCSTVLRDLCIEMESSAEGVERAAFSTNSANYFLDNHSNDNHLSSASRRPIPQDVASKYRQMFSLPNKPCLKTLLAITPYLIQNIKEVYVDCESTEPQNGLKGLSTEKIDHFLLEVRKAERRENSNGLVNLICRVLEKLCKKNVKDLALTEIEEMSESLEIRQMLKPLKRFFQHSQQDIRLHMRLLLFSRRLRDTLARDGDKIDAFPHHNVRNMLVSLIHFAKYDPSKIVRFELTDVAHCPLSCSREKVTYNKRETTYSQMFRVKKESEEVLQLHAVALVHIEEDKRRKESERDRGSFRSEIVLHASDERAFDKYMSCYPNIAVLKLKNKLSGNLRVILCSTQQEKLFKVKMASEGKLRLDCRTSEITWYRLKMASIESETGAFLSLLLVYKWGSEKVVLDSKDFVTLADCSVGGPRTFSETGQAAESSMVNPVSDEERDATPSDTDSSGQQEKRKTDSAADDTDPPEVIVPQLKSKDLPRRSESLDDRRLPVDILLLTVEDWEFLSCLSYLSRGFGRFYHSELGPVYLGKMGDGKKLIIAIMKCCKGSSVLVVENAVKVLGPKAVFAVGSCSGLDGKNVKLGDVVVLDKLITYGPSKVTENGIEELGVKVPLKPRLSKLTTAAGHGWKPPLKDTEVLEVKIHRGAFLSGQEVVDSPERCRALIKRFRGAVAIEGEGEGVYAAAHDLDIEWIVIKGISGFADGRKIKDSWRTFASSMAASVTAHILSDTIAFQDLPHYGSASKEKNKEDNSGMKSCNLVRQKESDTQPSQGGAIHDDLRQIREMEAKGNAGKTDPSLNLKKIAHERGFEISDNQGEGNCMFFAISEQLELIQGVKLSHRKLRKKVVRHLKKNPTLPDGTELFHFVEGYSSWDDYLKSMKADGTWGDHVILHGAANRFDTCIHVISSQRDYRDVIIHPQCEDADRKRLVLGHVCELHYVSLIPRKGTAKRQKRRLQTDEDDAHLDWGGEKKKKHKSGAKRCKQ